MKNNHTSCSGFDPLVPSVCGSPNSFIGGWKPPLLGSARPCSFASRMVSTEYRRKSRGSSNSGRLGFTLLETILALGMSALLMAGIYAAMDQSWRTATSGREEMERAQLARALIRRFEADIRAITFVPPPPAEDEETTTSTSTSTASTGTTGASSSAQSTDQSSTAESTEETAPNSKSMGLRGTNFRMELSIARARRDLLPGTTTAAVAGQTGTATAATATAATNSAVRTSDLRYVSYSFLSPGAATLSGLVRTEGDRMAVEVLEAKGAAATNITSLQVLAPEVSSFTLRYFDGRVWSPTWDSDTIGRIPRAVEISFSFLPPKRKPSIFNAAVSRSMDSFRTVILIPVSDPFPKDFVQ